MGVIRFLFALSVLSYHFNTIFPYRLFNGPIAVISFFITSGFYMALILDKKYIKKNKSYWLFITNRLFRVFPIYLITLFISLIFIFAKFFFHIGSPDNALSHYFFYASQEHISLFDRINFLLRNLTLILTADYFHLGSRTGGFLIIQQAWTLQVELLFYSIIPLLFRHKKVSLIMIGLYSIFFITTIYNRNFNTDTLATLFLSYFFFFILGIGSYYLYKIIKKISLSSKFLYCIFAIFCSYIIFYQFLPFHFGGSAFDAGNFIYYTAFSLILPFIFLATKKSRIDTFLGHLSYPIYITHIFFIKLLTNLSISNNLFFVTLVILTTIASSILLVKFIEEPIDHFRQNRLAKK